MPDFPNAVSASPHTLRNARSCVLACAFALSAGAIAAASGASGSVEADVLSAHQQAVSAARTFQIDHPGNGAGSDGASSDQFGYAVAIEGDWAFVGVPRDSRASAGSEGATYVYARVGAQWVHRQKLVATAASNQKCFGWSVAASGTTLAIASRRCTGSGSAAVNIFGLVDGLWVVRQVLSAPPANTEFGQALDLDGNTLVVGDVGSTAATPGGAIHLYARSGDSFAPQQVLTSTDSANGDQFGYSVSLAGNRVLVGAPFNSLGGFFEGSAYIFERVGEIWTQRQAVYPSDPESFGQFGQSVGLTSEFAVMGSPNDAVNDSNRPGSAYVYAFNGSAYAFQHKLRSNDGANGDELGTSLTVAGSTVIVGAPGKQFGANGDQGAAYAFVRTGGQWSQQARLTASTGDADDAFGFSVALAGDEVLIGANLRTLDGNLSQGAAYSFNRVGADWSQREQLTSGNGAALAQFGSAVAVDGEFAVVGAPGDNVGNIVPGAAYVFQRQEGSWLLLQRIVALDGAAGDNFGIAVDMDAETIVVGADLADPGATLSAGAAYVFVRTGGVWTQQQKFVSATPSSNGSFGRSLAVSGDTVVIGAWEETVGSAFRQGSAHVFVRDSGAWAFNQRLAGPDSAAFDRFGKSVDILQATIVVSAPDDDNGFPLPRGSVHVFERSGDTWVPQQKLTVASQFTNFGRDVALARDRVVVGTSTFGGGGAMYVFDRAGTTWSESQRLPIEVAAGGLPQGETVAIDGNTLAVHSPVENPLQTRVLVYHRRQNDGIWVRSAVLLPTDSNLGSRFGESLVIDSGQFIVGAPSAYGYDEYANPDSGSVVVFVDDLFADSFEATP